MESRLLSNSKVSTVRTPSESRIIERKNIEKRLQNLSQKQLQKIHINLAKQNQRLREQVQNFGQKVKKLIQSKKYQVEIKPNPLVQDQILKLKKQLQVKYVTMKDLKQQIKKQNTKISIQETSTNYKQKINQIRSMEVQIQQLTKQKQKIVASIKHNKIDFQEYLPAKDFTAQIQVLKDDSKTLRKKIYDVSIKIKQNQRTAKQALTKIYTLKKSNKDLQSTRTSRIKSLSVLGKYEIPPENHRVNQLKSLQQEIQILKRKKIDVQSQLTSDKTAKQLAKQKKQQQVNKLFQYHKRLSKRRVRQLTELNYLEKKQADIRMQNQLEMEKSKIPSVERAMQTQNFIKKEYRKDWIGRNEGIQFSDSELIEFKQTCLIKSLLVYRTTERIVFIRFGYQNPHSKYKYDTKIPFDKDSLKKIENKRVMSKNNGYLVNLTLSITKEIITRVQSHWSDGDSYVQGWQTQDSSKYIFDIVQNQRPIAFFGTVNLHPKGFYALQSLGCEILQKEQ